MAFKRLILICAVLMLFGCSTSGAITKHAFKNLTEETSIGENNIVDIKNDFKRFTSIIYNPKSQEAIDNSYQIIEKYCTESFIKEFKRDVNSYKPGQEQSVTFRHVSIGNKNNQFDSMDKLLLDLVVTSRDYKDINVNVEFTFNPNNKIFKYDIWSYEIRE